MIRGKKLDPETAKMIEDVYEKYKSPYTELREYVRGKGFLKRNKRKKEKEA